MHDRQNQKFEPKTQAIDDSQNCQNHEWDLFCVFSKIEFDSWFFKIETKLWNVLIFWAFLDEDFFEH